MKIYKILSAEYIKYNKEEEFKLFSAGELGKIFKTKDEAIKVLKEELQSIINKPFVGDYRLIKSSNTDFLVDIDIPQRSRRIIYNYKVVDIGFNSEDLIWYERFL